MAAGGRLDRRAKRWLAPLLALAVVAGLRSGFSSTVRRVGIDVTVAPKASLFDQAVDVSVTGLDPGQVVTVGIRSTDASGDPWQSSASFRADPAGSVDVNQSDALSGNYTGVVPMGLIETMSPANTKTGQVEYAWSLTHPLVFHVTAAAPPRRSPPASSPAPGPRRA